jgi:hypothetical protein
MPYKKVITAANFDTHLDEVAAVAKTWAANLDEEAHSITAFADMVRSRTLRTLINTGVDETEAEKLSAGLRMVMIDAAHALRNAAQEVDAISQAAEVAVDASKGRA